MEDGQAIFESLKIQLQKSGGNFLLSEIKCNEERFKSADENEALHKITQDLLDQHRTHHRCNDSRTAQEGRKGGTRIFAQGVTEPNKRQKHSSNDKTDQERENKGQKEENEEQKNGNKGSKQVSLNCQPAAAKATSQTTEGASRQRKQDNEREKRSAVSAQHPEGGPNNPILLDFDDPLSESDPVTIKDEEADQSKEKTRMTGFGDSRVEIREIFKLVLQSFNGAKTNNDSVGMEFYGYLKKYLEHKGQNNEFKLGDDAKTITQAMECFKEDKDLLDSNPLESFYMSCLIATIDEVKRKLSLA